MTDLKAYPVLFVDDEPDLIETFQNNFEDVFDVLTATGGPAALTLLERHPVAVMVTDQRMPEVQGLEVIRRGRELRPDLQPIILTGYTNDRDLVEAINLRCVNRYIAKPWEPVELRDAVERALNDYHMLLENRRLTEELGRANERLHRENKYLRTSIDAPRPMIGQGGALERVRTAIERVAPTQASVFIHGETGTGKELVARAIHAASRRRDRLFVAVNCAQISQNVPESQLFGHRKGAFTSAMADHKGYFEIADGGTIFLDEIGELSLPIQAMLLRVLGENEITPVGDNRPRKVDVRVVCATNRNLEEEIREKRFREDLYHRLNVFPVVVPPLRNRAGDVGVLTRHFLRTRAAAMGLPEPAIAAEALHALSEYEFPGNIRELENIIERALILSEPGETIALAHLPDSLQEPSLLSRSGDGGLSGSRDEFERRVIDEKMAENNGNKSRTAQQLGLTYRGLLKKMQRLGMVDAAVARDAVR